MSGVLGGILVVLIGLIFGRMNEKKHYSNLADQETELGDILTTNLKIASSDAASGSLVTGSVVIANDAFKKFISAFMLFFGGRVSVYETLMERARREALVRMKIQARDLGAYEVINVRIETSTIRGRTPQSVGSIEILAYGTALMPMPAQLT